MKTLNARDAIWPLVLILAGCGGDGSGSGSTAGPTPVTYSLQGRVQKGPFAIGSSIAVNEQSSNLSPNGTVFNTQTSDALGDFSVSSAITTPQVEIVAQGFYIDELTGKLSASQITLRAIADLSVNPSPTVNVLTTLQEPRLKALISQGQTFSAAYTQSESEVLAFFGIDAAKVSSLAPLTSMRIDASADSDSVLLAASVVLAQMATDSATANGTTQAAELSNLANTIAGQLASNGAVTSTSLTTARAQAEAEINVAAVTSNLQNYYATNGATVTAPVFQEWLDPSDSGVLPQRQVAVAGLTFTAVTNASPGQPVTSNSITISGIPSGAAVAISVSGGTTLIKNGTAVSGPLSEVTNGDTLALRVTAPGYLDSTQASIAAGTSSSTWQVTSQGLSGTVAGLSSSGLTLALNGEGSLTVPSGGTSFSFTSQLAVGAAYNITVTQQPNSPPQSCTVVNGMATVGAAVSNISITCTTPTEELVFVTASGSAAFFIDPTTGALGASGTPTGLATVTQVATDPSGTFLFAVDSSSVLAYAVSPLNGSFTAAPGSPYALNYLYPSGPTVDPTGNFLYVGSNAGALGYAIDGSSGALTAVTGNPFPSPNLGLSPGAVQCGVCLATASFLYYPQLLGAGSFNLDGFATDATTGALTSIGTVTGAGCCEAGLIASDPAFRFFYQGGESIQAYTINNTTGALTASGTALQAPSPTSWSRIVVDPSGKYAYLGNGTPAIYGFSIDQATGALTPLSPATTTVGDAPTQILFDRTGKFVYVENAGSQSQNISAFSFDALSGALTPVPGSPFPNTIASGGVGTLAVLQIH